MQLKVFGIRFSTLLTMKLLILLTVIACLQSSARGYGQTVTLSLENASLEKAFKEIKKQTGYSFVYTRVQLKNTLPVNCKVKNGNLKEVLELCFRNQPLSYLIEDRYIVIQTKPFPTQSTTSQLSQIDINGRVINETGEAVAGATIAAKNSNKATSTNDRGEFSLKGIQDDDVLVISSIGYYKEDVQVNKQNTLLIRLKIAVGSLDETIIMAYGKTSRRLNTGNISKVTAEEISRQPVSNPLAALQGRVPGVVITQTNGVPGSTIKIQIRGRNSLQQGTEPLFIIDGVPFAPNNNNINELASLATTGNGIGLSPFNSINPADIESIEILKDADATAIHGSRGANGVVLITTKKGKAGKTKLDFTSYSGFSKITRFMNMLNSQQYLQMRREAFQNDGLSPDITTAPDLLVWDTTGYTDFKSLLIGGTANTTDIQTSLSGGNLNTQFLFGIGLHQETTVFPGDLSDNRGSFKINVNHQSEDKKFNINLSANYSFDKNNLIETNSLIQYVNLPPNLPTLYDSVGNLKWEQGGIAYENPLAYLHRKYTMKADNLISNVQLSYKLMSGLFVRTNFGYNSYLTNEKSISPKRSQNPSLSPFGLSQFANRLRKSWIAEPQIEYTKHFKEHNLNVLMGTTWQQLTNNGSATHAGGYSDDALIESLSGATSIISVNDYSQYRYTALFGRINYNFSERYLLNLSGRRDGSSRFGNANRFSNFGAIGIGWIFSSERFIRKTFSWISYGKIRSSYGVTGNDQIGDYKYLEAWSGTSFPYQTFTGLFPNGLFNPDFEWESTKKLEIGVELGFLKDRLLFSASYFRNRSGNQLINYILPTQTGNQSILKNFPALIQNKGFEFSLTSKNIASKNFEWTTSANLTIPRNKLVAFPGIEQTSYKYLYITGQPLNSLYAYNYSGVDTAAGLYQFEDIDKDGSITWPNDLKVNGNSDPKYFGGLNNSFQYKGWQVNILFEFKKQLGQNFLSTFQTSPPGHMFNQPIEVLDRWQTVGEQKTIGKFTTVPFGSSFDAIGNLLISDGIYSDASFIRLKNISLSYNLSTSVLKKLHAQTCRIFLIGQNIFTVTNFKGPDPETQYLFSLPPLKTFAAGLQLTF